MPIIRTVFQPDVEIEVSDSEAASCAAMGLIVDQPPTDPEVALETAGEPQTESLPAKPRRAAAKTSDAPIPDPQGQPGSQEGEPGSEEGPTKEEGEVTA